MGKKEKLKDEKEQESKGLNQGAYDTVEIIPQTTKAEQTFDMIVDALKAGKYFVMREGYSRNSIYVLLKKLKEKADIEALFGQTKNNDITQFVLFVKTEKESVEKTD